MGYAQEFNRSMSRFSNFAVSFTIISILSGCLTLYCYGLNHGGPPTMLWGWLLVGGLVLFVAFAMAEVCSSPSRPQAASTTGRPNSRRATAARPSPGSPAGST